MAYSDRSAHRGPSKCSAARVATVAGYPEMRYEVQCPGCRVHLPAENLTDAGEIARQHRLGITVGLGSDGGGSGQAALVEATA